MGFINQTRHSSAPTLDEHIDQNIENIVALQKRDDESAGRAQRFVERISNTLGRPFYLIAMICAVLIWLAVNVFAPSWRWDPPPFAFLDGLVSMISLVTTTIVLVAQNRLTRREQQHSQLLLQVCLLTEQKVSKQIDLIEELRRDMPMVRDRHDPSAEALRVSADTSKVAAALAEVSAQSDTVTVTDTSPPSGGKQTVATIKFTRGPT